MKLLHGALALAAGVMMTAIAPATAQNFPTKPITIVLPFAPGGGGDLLARIVGAKLEQRLGVPVVIEPRPGGGGIPASILVAKSTADGYTLLMGTSSPQAINVTLFKKLPYDPATELIPVADVARSPFIMVVNPAMPIKTIAELIAYAKANPGKLSFGSSGIGTPGHIYMEVFKRETGTNMVHVPYRGTMPALTDVAAGHIPLLFCDLGPCAGQLESGGVRPLGIATKVAFPTAQHIRPIAELGVPGFDYAAWQMLFAPAKTPRDVIEKLHTEIKAVLDQPETKEQIIKTGFMPAPANPSVDELHAFVKKEILRWGDVVTKIGLAGSQ